MDKKIDERIITPEFLLTYFPSPDRYREMTANPPESPLTISKDRYIQAREAANKSLQGTGIKLSDIHLELIIKNMEGYLQLSKILKPNQHL